MEERWLCTFVCAQSLTTFMYRQRSLSRALRPVNPASTAASVCVLSSSTSPSLMLKAGVPHTYARLQRRRDKNDVISTIRREHADEVAALIKQPSSSAYLARPLSVRQVASYAAVVLWDYFKDTFDAKAEAEAGIIEEDEAGENNYPIGPHGMSQVVSAGFFTSALPIVPSAVPTNSGAQQLSLSKDKPLIKFFSNVTAATVEEEDVAAAADSYVYDKFETRIDYMFSALLSLREKAWCSATEEKNPQFAHFVQSTWCKALIREKNILMEEDQEKPEEREEELAELADVEDGPYFAAAHTRACLLQETFYEDPRSGLFVLTAHAHSKRGKCCGNGCRHCPFGHCNVRDKSSIKASIIKTNVSSKARTSAKAARAKVVRRGAKAEHGAFTVLSVGGGPGNDLVGAIAFVRSALCRSGSRSFSGSNSDSSTGPGGAGMRAVRAVAYDFSPAWAPACSAVNAALQAGAGGSFAAVLDDVARAVSAMAPGERDARIEQAKAEEKEDEEEAEKVEQKGERIPLPAESVALAHALCDVKAPWTHAANAHVRASIGQADLVLLSYVVYETAACQHDFLPSLLLSAAPGTVFVILDQHRRTVTDVLRLADGLSDGEGVPLFEALALGDSQDCPFKGLALFRTRGKQSGERAGC